MLTRSYVNRHQPFLRCASACAISVLLAWSTPLGFTALGATVASAQGRGDAHLEVYPRDGTAEDIFTLTVVVEGDIRPHPPQLNANDDFEVGSPSSISEISMINGSVAQHFKWSWPLTPKRSGTLLTPSVTIEVQGVERTLSALTLNVGDVSAQPSGTPRYGISVAHRLSRESVYVGEQVVSTVEIESEQPMVQPRLSDLAVDGVWQDSFGEASAGRKIRAGRTVDTISVRKALFPLRSGEIRIPSRELTTRVPSARRVPPLGGGFGLPFGLADPFSMTELREVSVRSEERLLNVKPLPQAPAGFKGWGSSLPVVGETQLRLSAKQEPLRPGESRTLEIEVTSLGSLAALKTVPLLDTERFKVYHESPETKSFENNAELVTQKRFRISLVPLRSGELVLPPIALGYFDPGDGVFKEAHTQELTLTVLPGAQEPSVVPLPEHGSTPSRGAAELEGADGVDGQAGPPAAASPRQHLSVTQLVLAVLALALVGIVGWLLGTVLIRRVYRRIKLKRQCAQLSSAVLLVELRATFIDQLRSLLKVPASTQGEELKRAMLSVLSSEGKRASALRVVSVLDDLDRGYFSGDGLDAQALNALKRRTQDALREFAKRL